MKKIIGNIFGVSVEKPFHILNIQKILDAKTLFIEKMISEENLTLDRAASYAEEELNKFIRDIVEREDSLELARLIENEQFLRFREAKETLNRTQGVIDSIVEDKLKMELKDAETYYYIYWVLGLIFSVVVFIYFLIRCININYFE